MTDTLMDFYQRVVKLGGADSLAAKSLAEQIRMRDLNQDQSAEEIYVTGGRGRTLDSRVRGSSQEG